MQVLQVALGRDHDDGNVAKMGLLLDPTASLHSVDSRHEHIHQDQVDVGCRLYSIQIQH